MWTKAVVVPCGIRKRNSGSQNWTRKQAEALDRNGANLEAPSHPDICCFDLSCTVCVCFTVRVFFSSGDAPNIWSCQWVFVSLTSVFQHRHSKASSLFFFGDVLLQSVCFDLGVQPMSLDLPKPAWAQEAATHSKKGKHETTLVKHIL